MRDNVDSINGYVWSPALVRLCLGTGLFFSILTRFVQVRLSIRRIDALFPKVHGVMHGHRTAIRSAITAKFCRMVQHHRKIHPLPLRFPAISKTGGELVALDGFANELPFAFRDRCLKKLAIARLPESRIVRERLITRVFIEPCARRLTQTIPATRPGIQLGRGHHPRPNGV